MEKMNSFLNKSMQNKKEEKKEELKSKERERKEMKEALDDLTQPPSINTMAKTRPRRSKIPRTENVMYEYEYDETENENMRGYEE